MSRSGRSVFLFGFWILLCGVSMIAAPRFVLRLMSLPEAASIVTRLLGMVLCFLSTYYFVGGWRAGCPGFHWVTVYTRFAALPMVAAFVLISGARIEMILFVLIDVAGAVWTLIALLGERETA